MKAAQRLKTIFAQLNDLPARWSASIIAGELPWERQSKELLTLEDEWVQPLVTDQYLRNTQNATFEVHNMCDLDGNSNDVWIAILDADTTNAWQAGGAPTPSVNGSDRCAVVKVKETVLLSGIGPDHTVWLCCPGSNGGSAKLTLNVY
jgi:hypothetical protein